MYAFCVLSSEYWIWTVLLNDQNILRTSLNRRKTILISRHWTVKKTTDEFQKNGPLDLVL